MLQITRDFCATTPSHHVALKLCMTTKLGFVLLQSLGANTHRTRLLLSIHATHTACNNTIGRIGTGFRHRSIEETGIGNKTIEIMSETLRDDRWRQLATIQKEAWPTKGA